MKWKSRGGHGLVLNLVLADADGNRSGPSSQLHTRTRSSLEQALCKMGYDCHQIALRSDSPCRRIHKCRMLTAS